MATYNDFFNMLHEEHLDVMEMLNQLKQMPSSDYVGREEVFTRMTTALIPHMKAEEKALYPVLRQNKASVEDAMAAMEQHHAAELIMKELTRMSKQEEFWGAKLGVFREMINKHVEDEENKLFMDARSALSEDQMQEITDNFENEKQSAKSKAMASSRR